MIPLLLAGLTAFLFFGVTLVILIMVASALKLWYCDYYSRKQLVKKISNLPTLAEDLLLDDFSSGGNMVD